MTRTVLAVDPGRDKCGLALVTDEGVRFRAIVPTAEVGLTCRYLLQQHAGAQTIVGEGTGAERVVAAILAAQPGVEITRVPERNSTRRARERYLQDNAGPWWQRLLPRGMRVPPRPVDDYAAVVLAEEYLRSHAV
ncbi:MAG: hypothetical protein KKI08_25470 [Armatimonadetes bacterium]|nr:hypothetical protein [Armatimonadota bacterium]